MATRRRHVVALSVVCHSCATCHVARGSSARAATARRAAAPPQRGAPLTHRDGVGAAGDHVPCRPEVLVAHLLDKLCLRDLRETNKKRAGGPVSAVGRWAACGQRQSGAAEDGLFVAGPPAALRQGCAHLAASSVHPMSTTTITRAHTRPGGCGLRCAAPEDSAAVRRCCVRTAARRPGPAVPRLPAPNTFRPRAPPQSAVGTTAGRVVTLRRMPKEKKRHGASRRRIVTFVPRRQRCGHAVPRKARARACARVRMRARACSNPRRGIPRRI
jgi:hypothetical protein